MNKLNKVTLTAATCGLDLGDGSERAEYVNQDYILKFIFSGIILMMTISHIAAVLTVIQPDSHLSRCETSDVMDRMLLLL